VALLVGATIASGVLLIAMQSHLTFFIDEWDLLLHRRGFSANAFLDPHAEHIVLAATIVYKTIQATLGMDSLAPFGVVSTAAFLASAVLLFVYIRRRVGEWLALAAVVLILFMGPAYDDLLSPFQVSFFGAMACGIGALLALERRDQRGDVIACVLLVVSLTFGELGLSFALGAAVAIALDRGPPRRAYVVAVPILLYVLWYLGWGHTGTKELSFDNLARSPRFVLDGFASNIASMFGLSFDIGRPILVALVVVAALRLRSLNRIPSWFWVTGAIAVSFWALIAFNAALGRTPTASRYQYVGAVLVLLVAAELARGVRPRWRVLVGVYAVVGAAALTNLSTLHRAYVGLHNEAAIVRGGLAGLEIGRDTESPSFVLTEDNSDFNYFELVHAGSYLSATDKFGSPAYTQAELAAAPEAAHVAADKVLASGLPVTFDATRRPPSAAGPAPQLVSPGGGVSEKGSCLRVKPTRGAPSVVSLPPGGAILRGSPGQTAQVSLRRYATLSFPIDAGTLRHSAVLEIPEDRSTRPWQMELDSSGPVTVCGLSAG
jgi:hypothetical protein